ncbi:protein of unknown function DUF1554 [Turneriella parva DSM 21527]|uniref:DUF1554 domain-containing protein n=2 Tax=Turneriella TaxID=338321 RepID=I4B349_TURPD|nr:protein of unknown function DUF1554 [Turneriella parva DSM 21527]
MKPCRLMSLFLTLWISNCMNIGLLEQLETPGGKTVSCGSDCRIFVTSLAHSGGMGGITGADANCNNDPARPQGKTVWKAMIGSTPLRTACTSADCGVGGASENFNWVLRPNTSYKRVDGAFIGNTTGNAIFAFPLQSTFDPSATFVWTGMTGSWQPSGNCTNWSVADSLLVATGDASSLGTIALFSTNSACNSSFRLYCAEQ